MHFPAEKGLSFRKMHIAEEKCGFRWHMAGNHGGLWAQESRTLADFHKIKSWEDYHQACASRAVWVRSLFQMLLRAKKNQ